MAKFTTIEDLFNTNQSIGGEPTEGGNGNEVLRFYKPESGIDVTYRNPNFSNSSSLDQPHATSVVENRDMRRTLGTFTFNNRGFWEDSNFNDKTFQSFIKGELEIKDEQIVITDGNGEEIVFNPNYDDSSTYRYSIDAVPFVTDPNDDLEIIRLDRYYDKDLNNNEYNLATEGKISYYLYPRQNGRTVEHNINTYGERPKFTGGGGLSRFDFYVSQSVSADRDDTGFFVFKLDWGDGTPIEHADKFKILEGTTLFEHFYEKPGFYSITGLVCAIFEGRILGGYEKFQTNIVLNPSINYELGLYNYGNFATIGGISKKSSLVKSVANVIGLNPNTLEYDSSETAPDLIRKINISDRLTIFNFLNKIDSDLNNEFSSFLNPYTLEIDDETETILETKIFGCTEPTALNYDENATDDDGTCVFNFNIDLLTQSSDQFTITPYVGFFPDGLPADESGQNANEPVWYYSQILEGNDTSDYGQLMATNFTNATSLRPTVILRFFRRGEALTNMIIKSEGSRTGFVLEQLRVLDDLNDITESIFSYYSLRFVESFGYDDPNNIEDGVIIFQDGEILPPVGDVQGGEVSLTIYPSPQNYGSVNEDSFTLTNEITSINLIATPKANTNQFNYFFEKWEIVDGENFVGFGPNKTSETVTPTPTLNWDNDDNSNNQTANVRAVFTRQQVTTDTGGNTGNSGAGRRKRGVGGTAYEEDDLIDPTGEGF